MTPALAERCILIDLSGKDKENLLFRESIMSNRVLSRRGARELTSEEVNAVFGASNACIGTLCGNRQIDDVHCNDL
jgi:hypothetical protein